MKTDIVPLRVDFAGGWTDCPKFAIRGAYIVNLTITPGVTKDNWWPHYGGGLGGSAAKAILDGKDPVASELQTAGWQDAAVIQETGLCVWRSGPIPSLEFKIDPSPLKGKMALLWTGNPHVTGDLVDCPKRDWKAIKESGMLARQAVLELVRNPEHEFPLLTAIDIAHCAQIKEGMPSLPVRIDSSYGAHKYCGAGWGGYAFYLFTLEHLRHAFIRHYNAIAIEPFMR